MIQSEPISFAVQIEQFSWCSQPQPLSFAELVGQYSWCSQPQPLSFAEQVGQYSWCITLISVFLALRGWSVAYKNAIKLATRSESKSIVDSISKLVTEILDLSLDFWLNKASANDDKNDESQRDGNVQAKKRLAILSLDFWRNKSSVNDNKSDESERDGKVRVKKNQSEIFLVNVFAKVQQVSKLSQILRVRGLNVPDHLLSSVIEKATLDCETAYKMEPEERAVRAQDIIDACMQDIECLYESFQSQHPPAEPKTFRWPSCFGAINILL